MRVIFIIYVQYLPGKRVQTSICGNKKKYFMISLVVHAGMKVASIAEKFMYIVRCIITGVR